MILSALDEVRLHCNQLVDTSGGGLIVPEDIIHPVISVLAFACLLWNLQLLNKANLIKAMIHIVVAYTYCIVFCFVLFVLVCCPRLLPISLDYTVLVPLRCSLTFIPLPQIHLVHCGCHG